MALAQAASAMDFTATPSASITSIWDGVYARLRDEFGEGVYRSWLKPMQLQAYYEGTMEISVPTRFMRDWIQEHYATQILTMLSQGNQETHREQPLHTSPHTRLAKFDTL